MIRFLAENEEYKVYSLYENVYLKNKQTSNNLVGYEERDFLIADHYGDPNTAIIMNSGKHIIVGGCGLTIYSIDSKVEKNLLDDPEDISWVHVVYQDGSDDQMNEFRFVSYFENDKLRVFKMNIESMEIEMLD